MSKIEEICRSLEEFAPLDLQESYDNAGLIVGDPKTELKGILFCIDSTEEVIDEAISKSCNLVIAHHPIIFKGIKKINNDHYVEKTIRKAIKNDIAIYASHTNLDNIFLGVNKKIADKINLNDLKILRPNLKGSTFGAGMIGVLKDEMSEKDFIAHIKNSLQLKVLRHSPLLGKKIRKVAICGGSGSFLTQDALEQNADAFVTGDIKYHEFFEANSKLLLIDVGHYESERFTIEIFHQVLSGKFPNIALHFSEQNTNPINYSF